MRPSTRDSSAGISSQFAADVRYYLTLEPRQLPSQYLYDDLGSKLFESICLLPWYPLKRAERHLLEAHADAILDDSISTLVELGPGNGEKIGALIAGASCRTQVDLHLIDISGQALADATRRLDTFPNLHVIGHQMTYEEGLEEFAAKGRGRTLALFLGSNIGNFDPPGREAFLRTMRAALRPGDGLLLGADLIRPEPELLLAYDDPLGLTAAFNRNLLVRINRELDASIDLEGFAHRALWNRSASRIEMHLASLRRQHVTIPAAQLEFDLNEGETIWTESSYKYEPRDIAALLAACGFQVTEQWIERSARFALVLSRAD